MKFKASQIIEVEPLDHSKGDERVIVTANTIPGYRGTVLSREDLKRLGFKPMDSDGIDWLKG